MRPKGSALKMNVMMTVELPGGVPSNRPESPAGEPWCAGKGGSTECPSGGYGLDSGVAFGSLVLALPVMCVCVSK